MVTLKSKESALSSEIIFLFGPLRLKHALDVSAPSNLNYYGMSNIRIFVGRTCLQPESKHYDYIGDTSSIERKKFISPFKLHD